MGPPWFCVPLWRPGNRSASACVLCEVCCCCCCCCFLSCRLRAVVCPPVCLLACVKAAQVACPHLHYSACISTARPDTSSTPLDRSSNMPSRHLALRILGLLLVVATEFGENKTSSSTPVQNSTSRPVGLQTNTPTTEMHNSVNNESGSSSSTPTKEPPIGSMSTVHDGHKTGPMLPGSPMLETSTGKQTTTLLTAASRSSSSSTHHISELTVTPRSVAAQGHQSYLGYIILVLLLISIIILAMIIYFLRKKTRHYSFDLYLKGAEDIAIPLSSVGQRGVFASTQNDEKPTEGLTYVSSVPEEQKTPTGKTLSQTGSEKLDSNNDPDKVTSEDSFGSQVPLTPNDKPLDFTFDLMDSELNHSSKTSSESLEEQQNANNNTAGSFGCLCRVDPNPAGLSETFTEISLDEPV